MNFIAMPEVFDLYRTNTRCDMFQGPCACGATHTAEDSILHLFLAGLLKSAKITMRDGEVLVAERKEGECT